MQLKPLLGRRVVLRYHHGLPGAGPSQSDAVGELVAVSDDSVTVHTRLGDVTISTAQVVIAREVLPDRRQILALEAISRQGWRATEVVELDGWLLSADHGWTGRANSCLPLRTPSQPIAAMLGDVVRFYRDRGLTPQLQLPMPARSMLDAQLAERGWLIERPTIVLAGVIGRHLRPTTTPPADPVTVTLDLTPAPDWLAGYHYIGAALPDFAVELLTRHDRVRFATAQRDGAIVGIARGVVDEDWLGVTAVEVAAEHRRSGVATALMQTLLDWGCDEGAHRGYLQLDEANQPALELYRGLGFTEHHRYHYRVLAG